MPKVTLLTRVTFRIRFLIKGEILSGFCVSGIFEFRYVLDLEGVEREGELCSLTSVRFLGVNQNMRLW